MKNLYQDIYFFLKQKIYIFFLVLTAALSYGFAAVHPSIGIDDTASALYFEDGLAPGVGRWGLYLINKVFDIGEYSPWITDVAGVILLMLSATVWCALFYQVLGESVSIAGYTFFAAVFISSPLISEVFVFFLHNGICMGYGITAISLYFALQAMKKGQDRKNIFKYSMLSTVNLIIAIGFYESFEIVYIIGILLLFYLLRMKKEICQKTYCISLWHWVALTAGTSVLAIIGRTIMMIIICTVFNISIPDNFQNVEFRGVMGNTWECLSDFAMVIKKFVVMYYLNAFCYLPITVFVLGIAIILTAAIIKGICKRDMSIILAAFAVIIVPFAMPVMEGYPTHYRESQYVPLIGAFAVLLLAFFVKKNGGVRLGRLTFFAVSVLLWNQCADMNRWFYVDYMKYENEKKVMDNIAYTLEEGSYNLSKPIIFRGAYLVPYEIARKSYLGLDTKRYNIMKKIADLVDVHLLEKFNAEDGGGYVFTEMPINSTLRWGVTAFDGTAGELGKFWRMHGYNRFYIETDLEKIAEAEEKRKNMPGYPEKGYIKECEEYIIINMARYR